MINKWLFRVLIIFCSLTACKEKRRHKENKVANAITPDPTLKWIDYRIGELPPVGYYSAFDSIIRKWDIRYQRIEGGCEATPEERSVYEKHNPKYFKVLESQFGKDWLTRFHAQVEALQSKEELASKRRP